MSEAPAKYKKRVIQADSDESEEEAVPLAKRTKVDEDEAKQPVVVTHSTGFGDNPKVEVDTKPLAEVAKPGLKIFSTGSDSEDDTRPTPSASRDSESEDEKPLASSAPKPKPKPAAAASNGKANGKKPSPQLPESSMPPSTSNGDDAAAMDTSSDSEKPLKKAVKPAPSRRAATKPTKQETPDDDDDDEDEEEDFMDEDSEDEKPKKKAAKKAAAPKGKKGAAAATNGKGKAPAKKVKKEESESPEKPKASTSKSKAAVKSKVKAGKGKAKKEGDEDPEGGDPDDEDDGVFKWWEEEQDGSTKWKTLEHNGVLFPEEYKPHGVKMLYDGKPVKLPPESEEVATFFGAMLETDHAKKKTFYENFFHDFVQTLKEFPPLDGTVIKKFELCDFTPIYDHCEEERLAKKNKSAAQKKADKEARDALEAPYKFALLDGRKEKLGNFRVEPPGLFRGRGEHPRTGHVKKRLRAEDITLNLSKDAPVPPPPAGHKWKAINHDDKVTWLATWHENINNNVKYVFLSAGSSLKGQSDFKKFEKARKLQQYVDQIRKDYTKDMKDKEMFVRQRAVAMYLIDRFALRAGNEKGDDEADTVGCCSLRYEHVMLEPPRSVTFDFLGKDSIRYVNTVEVDEQVHKNIKIFKKDKEFGDMLFDRLQTGLLNKYLLSYMEGLTAKVFRTYNASYTFVQQLKGTPEDGTVNEKFLHYQRANRMVAILCNHQKSVSKNHESSMEKLHDKVRSLKYQRRKLRCALVAADKSNKKKHKALTEEESDIDEEWIDQHEDALVELEKEKIKRKFDKENKKLEEDGKKIQTDDELQTRLKAVKDFEKDLKADRKDGWTETSLSTDKLVAKIEALDVKISAAKATVVDRDEGKEVSLGTSKINYIDPRLTFAWCAKYDVPVSKVFSKTLIEKFPWAAAAEADFEW